MPLKEVIENNLPLFFATAIVTGFAAGWGSHLGVTSSQQAFVDLVPKGSYVLKEEIESGKAPAYVTAAEVKRLKAEKDAVLKQLALLEQGNQADRPYFTSIGFTFNDLTKPCKDQAIVASKSLNLMPQQTVEGTQIYASGGKYQVLVHCGVRLVFVVGPNAEAANSLRQSFVSAMQE